jgi:phosphoglycerate dehydrogenase-like enzyme
MSDDDVRAEHGNAAAAKAATGLPLVGLTLASDAAWSARVWEKTGPRVYERQWCTHVRVVGDRLAATYNDALRPPPRFREHLRRTVSAWGEDTQADLARLHIGIVGAGSVGSIIAEALARTGIAHLTLIDFDDVETLNLDRLLHATDDDVAARRSKVEVLSRALRRSATAEQFRVDSVD